METLRIAGFDGWGDLPGPWTSAAPAPGYRPRLQSQQRRERKTST